MRGFNVFNEVTPLHKHINCLNAWCASLPVNLISSRPPFFDQPSTHISPNMFGTSRFNRGAPASKFQDDTFEMGSRSFSSDGASSTNSYAVEDTLELGESSTPRMKFAAGTSPTQPSTAPPIDAPENQRKFAGTTSSTQKLSLSFMSLFIKPRKQRQSSTSSLSSVDSTGIQL